MHMNAFAVLGDGTRRQLLARLRSGARSVNELVAALGVQQPGVSRHLRILRDAGFVRVRPHGQRRIYCLNPAPFRALEDWLAGYRGVSPARRERPRVLSSAQRAKRAPRTRKAR